MSNEFGNGGEVHLISMNADKDRDVFIYWVIERAKIQEFHEKNPFNAFILLEAINSIPKLKFRNYQHPTLFIDSLITKKLRTSIESPVFLALKSNLKKFKELSVLWKEYSLELRYTDFQSQTPTQIAFKLLDREQNTNTLKQTIQTTYKAYTQQEKLDFETKLQEYSLQSLKTQSKSIHIENRVIMILTQISNMTFRHEILIELMKRSNVPCTGSLTTLISTVN